MIKAIIRWFRGEDNILENYSSDYSLWLVADAAWAGGFTVSSDFARAQAPYVAMAATLGLITSKESDGSFGRTWYVTHAGLRFLETVYRGG